MMPNSKLRALVEEMRGGLDGVTPGPWKAFVKNGVRSVYKGDEEAFLEVIKWTGFDASDFPENASKNARHFSRCSPENIALLLTAAEAHLASSTDVEGWRDIKTAPVGEIIDVWCWEVDDEGETGFRWTDVRLRENRVLPVIEINISWDDEGEKFDTFYPDENGQWISHWRPKPSGPLPASPSPEKEGQT